MTRSWAPAPMCWQFVLSFIALAGSAVQSAGVNEGDDRLRLVENEHANDHPWLTKMALLPEQYAPSEATWCNSVAVCAIMRDEPIPDIIEWLAYYRWLGVDHVFLTDNGSEKLEEIELALWEHFPPSFLTLRQDDYPHAQLKVYAWCAETQRVHFNWLAFFDLDEFLGFPAAADPKQPPKLADFLDGYKDEAGLSVSWIMVGPSGQEERPEDGGVLRTYDECVVKVDQRVKTIANTWFLQGLTEHPHDFVFRDGRLSVDEHRAPLTQREWRTNREAGCDEMYFEHRDCQLNSDQKDTALHQKCCFWMTAAHNVHPTAEKVALYHYATKSREDFEEKMERGSGMSQAKKDWSYFDTLEEGQEHDPFCEIPGQAWQGCCSPEALQSAMRADLSQEQGTNA